MSFNEFKAYVEKKFPAELLDLEGIGWQMDVERFTQHFFNNGVVDASADVNANVRTTHVYTYFNDYPKVIFKFFSLYLIYTRICELFGPEAAEQFLEEEITGGIYVHDLFHAAFQPYCYAYSLGEIVRNGLQFIDNIKSAPAKHLDTFIQHVIQFVMFASNQQSGAVGLPDLFVWMWYFVMKDVASGYIPEKDWRKHVEQAFQVFTYSINQPIRGTQSPYVNVTYLDRNYIRTIFADETYPDGSKIVDHTESIIALQKLYWEWVAKEREKQMFTFPVMTASFLFKNGNFVDEDSAKFVARVNTKWCDTNLYIADTIDAIASCCRLQSSIRSITFDNKLRGVSNSIGGSDLNIGSFKVITINLPRIALESKSPDIFIEQLRRKVRLVCTALAAIRSLLEDRIRQGVLPLYNFKLMSLDRQFGTVGITGVWEAAELLNLVEEDVDGLKYSEAGEKFVTNLLDLILEELEYARYKFGFTFNVEQVPAEKAAVTLAEKDRFLFGTKYALYSNQWIPLTANTDVLNRIKYSGMWDSKTNGGAILHVTLDGPIPNEKVSYELIKSIAKAGVKYFAFNTKISVCSANHAFYGQVCPLCGSEKVDEFTRIVGYLVPSKGFNKTRRLVDLPNRMMYHIDGG